MDDAKPSLAKRALAIAVLVVVAVVVFRVVLGIISAIFWIVALIVLAIAALWAVTTLRSAKKDFDAKRARKHGGSPKGGSAALSEEDRLAAELAQLRSQLRDQGRL